jgi:hypothetical protein
MELEHLDRNLTKKSIDIQSEMKFVSSFFIFKIVQDILDKTKRN